MTLADRLKKLPFTPLQLAIHVYAWQGPLVLIYSLFTHHLTANPLQAIQQRTGRQALMLLVLSLACTPLTNITGWHEPLKRSRTLGLYAFMLAFLHVLVFLVPVAVTMRMPMAMSVRVVGVAMQGPPPAVQHRESDPKYQHRGDKAQVRVQLLVRVPGRGVFCYHREQYYAESVRERHDQT